MTLAPLTILAFAPRRRNHFLRQLREAAERRGFSARIHGFDTDRYDTFGSECDRFAVMAPLHTPEGQRRAQQLMRDPLALVLGWNDLDIAVLSRLGASMPHQCAILALPQPQVVRLMHDKRLAKEWAQTRGFMVAPDVSELAGTSQRERVVVKPRRGQGSLDVYICKSEAAARVAIGEQSGEYLVERFIEGDEYTVDVIAFEGELVAAVPRKRIKVRGGEVLVAQVHMRQDILDMAARLCTCLGGSMVFNFQVIDSAAGLHLIEMNPRFGGGSDLSMAAGLDLPGAYIDLFVRRHRPPSAPAIRDGLVMSRRLESSFFMAES